MLLASSKKIKNLHKMEKVIAFFKIKVKSTHLSFSSISEASTKLLDIGFDSFGPWKAFFSASFAEKLH